jgi:hypothetical protein
MKAIAASRCSRAYRPTGGIAETPIFTEDDV